jgi:hypothetical protein
MQFLISKPILAVFFHFLVLIRNQTLVTVILYLFLRTRRRNTWRGRRKAAVSGKPRRCSTCETWKRDTHTDTQTEIYFVQKLQSCGSLLNTWLRQVICFHQFFVNWIISIIIIIITERFCTLRDEKNITVGNGEKPLLLNELFLDFTED